jgi:hypothetical protein
MFVVTGVTAMAAACVGNGNSPCLGQTQTGDEPAGEDGSQFWLRHPCIEAAALPRYVLFARGITSPVCHPEVWPQVFRMIEGDQPVCCNQNSA